jgi:hypothetical protein
MMMMMMVIMMTMTTIPDPIQHMNMELLFVRGRWLDWSADVKRLECFAVGRPHFATAVCHEELVEL